MSSSNDEYFTDSHNSIYSQLAPPPPSYSNLPLQPRLLTAPYYVSDSSTYESKESYKGSLGYKFSTINSNYSSLYHHYKQHMFRYFYRNIPPSEKVKSITNVSFSSGFEENSNIEKNQPIYMDSPPPFFEVNNTKDNTKLKKKWRPYFTFLTTLIMLAYFAACLVKNYQFSGHVLQLSPFNIMIGPSAQTLIYTGARYSPCIRASYLYPVTKNIYQCPNRKVNKTVTPPIFNDQTSFQYPLYSKNMSAILSSKQHCDLQQVCGGTRFLNSSKPDQGYRFISALFMHSGIVQLLINLIIHIKVGIKVEKQIHPVKYGIIWLTSGVFGYIFGSLFIPESNVNVGCSVSLMGIMAFLYVDLIRNWQRIIKPWKVLMNIMIYFVIALVVGMLPGYDNYAHIGGFIGGIMITLVFMPMATLPKYQIGRQIFMENAMHIWLLRIMVIAFMAVLLWILINIFIKNGSRETCILCQYFSCLPISDLCHYYN
ncbi:uncharacterized protein BX663DRAFT_474618 [Cokeromyces recurvatus]|uniref:uncharacterized protein n=1 Tax=Cokeromyces recurvatus TaxID=90255 RepID=UPI00222055DF|nr:uncharacterized protein BX663DRAFT_474618 [Cokeromyces recurvatus]KAI7901978.1 hypothetical protein BX663DRAFT_474618 [Cokeromyces recurvatus]